MATLTDTQRPINDLLIARLRAAGCVRGRFAVDGAAAQFSLTGERADGKPLFFWDFNDRLFNRLVADYLAAGHPAGSARLTVDVEVESGHCAWQFTSAVQQAAATAAGQQQELRARKNRRRDRTPYGAVLAGQVADALVQGQAVAFSHRDYCGMGLRYRNQQFCYGELYDGDFIEEPQQIFASRAAFVQWLAQQSDQSLARTEEPDPWYWDNQTITRQRLETFVQ
ncbi:hypothetical protein Q5H92_10585 [Hymenobacter sp. M29]|uniref:Uncharacterized protein n=1 Tax=Hymenobacter mellowenesis TaxID=3063995 RepID=A0ABT9AAF8_9BACT|nr:hypothetical protein [Hymenobacter sp. M29]MDO7846804.1 hypothetical protein [Hymenobacter sp. M29]